MNASYLHLDIMDSILTSAYWPQCNEQQRSLILIQATKSLVKCRHPDLWAFCNIIATRHKGEPPDISSCASGGTSLLPHFSAAEMLWTPILARGAGLQLKRASNAS